MKKVICTVLAITAAILTPCPLMAHDGDHPPDMRKWRDVDGLFEIEGSFVLARDEKVQILKHGGVLVSVPLEKLSHADRAWVRARVEAIRRINHGTDEPISEIPSSDSAGLNPTWLALSILGFAFVAAWIRRGLKSNRWLAIAATLIATANVGILAVAQDRKPKPAIQTHFEPFKDKLKFRSDNKWFFVESDGMPDHRMMVGITAWQQQVPIPQKYKGNNAWQIPLFPQLSDKPVSARKQLFRGAIALAANGVPIFNPIKNDGRTDTFLAGELDEYGGHCGRGDDYHYHIAPIHLEKVVGKGKPIGYALDGYPLYGFTDAEGKEPKDLDEFNGRMEKGGYRYYSTKRYPYVNGGLRGVVTVKDDQIDPQPRAYSPRPALTPLRGARITGFERDDSKNSVSVKYEINGKSGSVKYTASKEKYEFEFTDTSGKVTTQSYPVREDGKRPPPKKKDAKDDRPPPTKKDGPPPKTESAPLPKSSSGFTLTSPAFEHKGKMPAEYTGDGNGISPPLKWSGAPEGTKFYALQLWHKPRADGEEVKSYWVVTNIPATITSLEKNSQGVGKPGMNDKRRPGYDPMNSKGPGAKEYHITLYALSEEPRFDTDKFTRIELLKAIKGITLAETTLSYTYERKAKSMLAYQDHTP
jgi:phosphatidylethanolamine-binding protein (PEBP) family uncharacterized protein